MRNENMPDVELERSLCRVLAVLMHANRNVTPGWEATVDTLAEKLGSNMAFLKQTGLLHLPDDTTQSVWRHF